MQLLCSHITRWGSTQCGSTPGRQCVCVRGSVTDFFLVVAQISGSVCPLKWEWERRLCLFTCAYMYQGIVCMCWTSFVSVCTSKWEDFLRTALVERYVACECTSFHWSTTFSKWHWESLTLYVWQRGWERCKESYEREKVGDSGRECWHVVWPRAISLFFKRSFGSSSAKWALRFLSSSRLVIISVVTAKAQL